MFEDFDEKQTSAEDRKRMGTSMLASGVVLLALGAAGAAMAVTTTIVRRAEPQAEVHFEPMPEAPPPPPAPRQPPPPRPRNRPPAAAVRQDMRAPTEIPEERPAESDEELADAGDTGAVDGELGGVPGGDGDGSQSAPEVPAAPDEEARLAAMPQLVHESITLPRRIGGCERPEYPQAARTRGLQDRVVVRVRVREDGSIGGVDFLRGEDVFHEAVRHCVETMQFEPAHLSDGTAIAHARTLTFPFRLTNL